MKILKLSAAVAGLLMGSAALAGGSCTNANLSAWDDTRDDSGSQVEAEAGWLFSSKMTSLEDTTLSEDVFFDSIDLKMLFLNRSIQKRPEDALFESTDSKKAC